MGVVLEDLSGGSNPTAWQRVEKSVPVIWGENKLFGYIFTSLPPPPHTSRLLQSPGLIQDTETEAGVGGDTGRGMIRDV